MDNFYKKIEKRMRILKHSQPFTSELCFLKTLFFNSHKNVWFYGNQKVDFIFMVILYERAEKSDYSRLESNYLNKLLLLTGAGLFLS